MSEPLNSARMMALLKSTVAHIEAFEEDEAQNVLKSLGFTKNELKEIFYGSYLTEEELKNIDMIERAIPHNGDIIWSLSPEGASYIFSDQIEDESSGVGWKTEAVPFPRYSHYVYDGEYFGDNKFTAYAWYGSKESYVNDFKSLNECLDWLVPERQLSSLDMQIQSACTRATETQQVSRDRTKQAEPEI